MSVQFNNAKVGATGFGLMSLTCDPGNKLDHEYCISVMKAAVDSGATLWNSAEAYGVPHPPENMELIAEYFEKYPEDIDKVYLTVKGCCDPKKWSPDNSVQNTRRSIEEMLEILGKYNKPDVFIVARQDPRPEVDNEECARTIKEYLDNGKLKAVGLSEVNGDTIRKWNQIVPIKAVEIQFSIWAQEAVEHGVMSTCKELDIPVLAYSPLGYGYLTGAYKSTADYSSTDMRKIMPRFEDENLKKNYGVVEFLKTIAEKYGTQPSTIALEYIRQKSDTDRFPVMVPIPGTTKSKRVISNCERVDLSFQDINQIDEFMAGFEVSGGRYAEDHEKHFAFK